MWISCIYPCDDLSSTPQTYVEEVYHIKGDRLPIECYQSFLLYRFYPDDHFDDFILESQGFHYVRPDLYIRSFDRESYKWVLDGLLSFNWDR